MGVVAGLGAAAAVAYFVFFVRSDEHEIRRAIARLAGAVEIHGDADVATRATRLRNELRAVVAEDVRVTIQDLPRVAQGRDEIAEAAEEAELAFSTADIDVRDVDVQVDEAHVAAKAGIRAALRAKSRTGEAQRDERDVDLLLRKDDGAWRITSITVWPSGGAAADHH